MVANVFDLSHSIGEYTECADILVLKINHSTVKDQFICIAGRQEEETVKLAHANWIDIGIKLPVSIENIVTTLKKISNGSGELKCIIDRQKVKISWE